MQVPPGPACSLSYLWETKKVLDMNMVSDCCTSSRSTSAMVHCSRRGSSSFLSPSNMPYTASTPSAKLPSARDDTHSLSEKHRSKVNMSQKIILLSKPQPSGTMLWVPFSQGSKATVPTFTRLGDVQLHFIIGTPKPSLTTCRRGQQAQLVREKASLLEREEEPKCTEINVKIEAKGNVKTWVTKDLVRDPERQMHGWALGQTRSAWVLSRALWPASWENSVSCSADHNTHLFLWPASSATPWLQKAEVSVESAVREGLASIFSVAMWLQREQKLYFSRTCWTGLRILSSLGF